MSTRHVEVEAGPGQTAQLIFPRPITSLRFESASSLIPLSIELVVDSASILDVDAAPGVNAVVSASFSVPTSTVTLRSRTAYAQNVGIDNLAYDFARCE